MNRLVRTLSAIFAAAVLFSAIPTATVGAAAKIKYDFTGDEAKTPGYAEGKITVTGLSGGKHFLYWADSKKALGGFYEIAELDAKNGSASVSFGDHAAIPAGAEKLIVCSGSDTTVKNAEAVYDIPAGKRLRYKPEDANYTFMNYSDIHIDVAKSVFYRHSELHWKKALETAANRKADFIVTAGDNITNADGPEKEFDRYQQILADSPYVNPIYECSGNHELRTGTAEQALKTFNDATGLDGTLAALAGGKPYFSVTEPKSGDLFIFMALEYEYDPYQGEEFSDEQLNWFENLLKENYGKDKNIYLIQHALIEGYGAGDDKNNYYTVPLNPIYDSTEKFRKIIEKYPDLIWMSGHTHIALKYGYNYSDMNGKSCHMIHDSSVCCPTLLDDSTHKLSYVASAGDEYEDFTEGYYVQVFDDEIIYNGENLYHDKIYPTACYIMESCRKTAPKERTGETVSTPHRDYPDAASFRTLAVRTFTMPKTISNAKITEADLASVKSRAESLLESLYTFSSYDAYQALKREVTVKNGNIDESYRNICSAYLSLLPYEDMGEVNVFFANSDNWSKVYARLSSSKGNSTTEEMTYAGKDGNDRPVYTVKVNYHKYNTIEFTDGTDENISEPQSVNGTDRRLFVLNENDFTAPFFCYEDDLVELIKE